MVNTKKVLHKQTPKHPSAIVDGHWTTSHRLLKRALRLSLEGVALTVVIMVVVQLSYPPSMALPQTRIGGKNYGYKSAERITSDILAVQQQKMRITTATQTLEFLPKDVGINLTASEDARKATDYNWLERLLPFSMMVEKREIPHYGFTIDEAKAKQFAASLKKYDTAPVNATVKFEGSRPVVVKQQNGRTYDTEQLVKAIKGFKLTNSMTAALQPTIAQPAITNDMAMKTVNTLQQRLQKPITVQSGDKSLTADANLLASWMVATDDNQAKELRIDYDREKIGQWLGQLAPQIYRPGAPRTVTMLDGQETGGTTPADGQSLDVAATTDALINTITTDAVTVEAKVTPIIESARTIRNYTRSSQGLQALLDYWDTSNAGTWGIVVKEVEGGVSASINPDRQFTSASVYKLYVAYATYIKSDSGEINMGSPTGNGNTVSGCMDLMIVRSDNDCATELGGMVGWGASNGMLRDKGFNATSIAYGGQLTTAQDTTNFLLQLHKGSLLSEGNKQALLDKMGRNIYRYAIPAGSPTIRSANKLGALGVYNHDVAIVYHPKGAYVLSAFSQGSSHARIRELARQISAVMGQ